MNYINNKLLKTENIFPVLVPPTLILHGFNYYEIPSVRMLFGFSAYNPVLDISDQLIQTSHSVPSTKRLS